MAGAGFCDSRPLLDLHPKVDDHRAPLKIRPCLEQCGSQATLRLEEHGQAALNALVPSLLRREVELALEKLNLVWDRTYAWDMFLDMMRDQGGHTFSTSDLPLNFTNATRAILIDWIIKIHEMMHFQDETLFLTIHLLNRSLCLLRVSTSNLQLLGAVCLFIAAKKEESLLPEVSDLCYMMDHTYTKQQLLKMERKVLSRLKFDLSFCPPLNFLFLFAAVARCSAKDAATRISPQTTWMARYFLELSLMEGECVAFQPVQLAEAALCLSRLVLKEPATAEGEAAWCLVSSLHLSSVNELLRIMSVLAKAAAIGPTSETCASFLKFSSNETLQVSQHPALTSACVLLGALQ